MDGTSAERLHRNNYMIQVIKGLWDLQILTLSKTVIGFMNCKVKCNEKLAFKVN